MARAGDAAFLHDPTTYVSPTFAICKAAGWTYCAEHDRPLNQGSEPCRHLHATPTWEHAYYCPWPDGECLGAPCEEVQRAIR